MDKDAKLIFEAYRGSRKVVTEAQDKNSEATRSVTEIRTLIDSIFAANNVTPSEGTEAFWNAVKEVERVNHVDGKRLRQLGSEWEKAYQRENIVKPHLANTPYV